MLPVIPPDSPPPPKKKQSFLHIPTPKSLAHDILAAFSVGAVWAASGFRVSHDDPRHYAFCLPPVRCALHHAFTPLPCIVAAKNMQDTAVMYTGIVKQPNSTPCTHVSLPGTNQDPCHDQMACRMATLLTSVVAVQKGRDCAARRD